MSPFSCLNKYSLMVQRFDAVVLLIQILNLCHDKHEIAGMKVLRCMVQYAKRMDKKYVFA